MSLQQFHVADLRKGPTGLGDVILALRPAMLGENVVYILPRKDKRLAPVFEGIAPVIVSDEWPEKSKRLILGDECHDAGWLDEISKPIALCINCSTQWKHLRETDPRKWQELANHLQQERFTIIQYGISLNFTPLKGVKHCVDLPVAGLACHYHKIGKYIGVDTGDMHLAFGVGAHCWVARPKDCSDYPYTHWQYNDERMKYFSFDQIPHIYDSIASG